MSTNNTKQAFWVALGNFFTFSFGIVSAMVLSRYFDKTEYGTYKQVFYIYNILLGMFTLGLPNAYSYFLARSPLDQAKNLIWKMTRLFMKIAVNVIFSRVTKNIKSVVYTTDNIVGAIPWSFCYRWRIYIIEVTRLIHNHYFPRQHGTT